MDLQEVIVTRWMFLLISIILFVWGMGSMIWNIFSTSSQETNLFVVPAINHPKPDVKSTNPTTPAAELAATPGSTKKPGTRDAVMNKPSPRLILCKPGLPTIPEELYDQTVRSEADSVPAIQHLLPKINENVKRPLGVHLRDFVCFHVICLLCDQLLLPWVS
jgi:hypothetical protein